MIKALLATALSLTTCLGANASWVNQHGVTIYDLSDVPTTHKPLFRALQAANVPVINGKDWKQCNAGEYTYLGGFYSPGLNFIVLCPQAPGDNILETLVHEAVHAVQDCRAGQANGALIHKATPFMVDMLPAEEIELIKRLYPADQHWDEVEARFLDIYPNHVATLLNNYCL